MTPEKRYYKNGQIQSATWRNEAGKLHRLDGPAYRYYYKNGQVERETWLKNGEVHRLDGPAWRVWHKNGQINLEQFWINGVKYETEAEFQVAVDLYKANEIAELF